MITKRNLLITAGSTVLITGLGLNWAITKSITTAQTPWETAAKGFGDTRLDILAYAILAPNPHNRQPWQIDLVGEDEIHLYCDLTRMLPHTDPQNRQITIGLGAFLELLRQAAAEKGLNAQINLFPDGESWPQLDKRPIAKISLLPDRSVKPDPLFQYAIKRRTARVPFEKTKIVRALDMQTLLQLAERKEIQANTDKLQTIFFSTTNNNKINHLKNIIKQGWNIESTTPKTHHESIALTRIGADEIIQNPDGISLHGKMIEALRLLKIFTKEKYAQKDSIVFNGATSFYEELIDTASCIGWLSSATNSRESQIYSGMHWVRLNLAATQLNIAMHPLSQTLQEFPEMSMLYNETHQILEIEEPKRIQGLFRFGYAMHPTAAPRWPLKSRLINL